MSLYPGELLLDDSTDPDVFFKPVVDGEPKGRGHDPDQVVREMFAAPSQMTLIPRSEWSARIKEMEETKSRLSDIRLTALGGEKIPSQDQNGQGYCWAYSVTATVMIQRAVANLPHVYLSAHAVACKVKNFRDQGGWCGLSAQYIREHGVPSKEFWPLRSMSRSHDTPATWENAAKHKITEDWVDLSRPVYGQNLTFDQLATCLLNRVPCAVDYSWWAHSVCALDLVEVEPGSFGVRIWNSWSENWSDRGMGVLRGRKAIPDGALATRTTVASAA